MSVEVRLPQWGMGMTEGTVVKWLKEVGDQVEAGEPIVEIEAAKATSEVNAPVAGTLTERLYEEDDTVEVQAVLAIITP